jgi:hypothetical protein
VSGSFTAIMPAGAGLLDLAGAAAGFVAGFLSSAPAAGNRASDMPISPSGAIILSRKVFIQNAPFLYEIRDNSG